METSQILTDSLTALHLVSDWGRWAVDRMLRCADRREVHWVVSVACAQAVCPVLEKVKAHDARALELGHPKALGNDHADRVARCAASSPACPPFLVDLAPFGDPVELVDAAGVVVSDVEAALAALWWDRRQLSRSKRRPWLDALYPPDVPILWPPSLALFQRPAASGDHFIHPAPVPVVKWTARVRAGCLASRLRLFTHSMGPSPVCPLGDAEEEDEAHMVSGCAGTGSIEWRDGVKEAWLSAAEVVSAEVPVPPLAWVEAHQFQLLAALIPASVEPLVPLPPPARARFLRHVSIGLAAWVAERLRRREALIAGQASATPAPPAADAPPRRRG